MPASDHPLAETPAPPSLTWLQGATLSVLASLASLTLIGYRFGDSNHGITVPILKRFIDRSLYTSDVLVATGDRLPTIFHRCLAALLPSTDWVPVAYYALYVLSIALTYAAVYRLGVWASAGDRSVGGLAVLLAMPVRTGLAGESLYRAAFSHSHLASGLDLMALALFLEGWRTLPLLIVSLGVYNHALYSCTSPRSFHVDDPLGGEVASPIDYSQAPGPRLAARVPLPGERPPPTASAAPDLAIPVRPAPRLHGGRHGSSVAHVVSHARPFRPLFPGHLRHRPRTARTPGSDRGFRCEHSAPSFLATSHGGARPGVARLARSGRRLDRLLGGSPPSRPEPGDLRHPGHGPPGGPGRRPKGSSAGAALQVLAFVLALGPLFADNYRRQRQRFEQGSFRAAQNWARTETPKSAVFLTPPKEAGFPVFSERSIVGEWKDGTQQYFDDAFAKEWGRRMEIVMAKEYGQFSDDEIVTLARQFGADYIVGQGRRRKLPLAFDGGSTVVYSLPTIR